MSKTAAQPSTLSAPARWRKHRAGTRAIVGHPNLMDTLVQCGVQLPEECNAVELKAPCDGLMQIIYTCNVTGALAHKIGKALQVQAVKDRLS